MSTKIYNAYIFPKKLSINELTEAVLEQKKIITKEAQKRYFKQFICDFVQLYDENCVHTKEWMQEKLSRLEQELAREKDDTRIKVLKNDIVARKDILQGKHNVALLAIDWKLSSYIELYEKNENVRYHIYNYKSILLIIPYKSKLLAMTFGNPYLNMDLIHNLQLEDYHYQSQSDRPENITEKEWKIREKTWDNAIGPDYIPNNHGFTFDLIDKSILNFISLSLERDNDILTKENVKACVPDMKRRIEKAIKSFDDYPNPPSSDASYSDWLDYMETEEYKKWYKQKYNFVKKKLKQDETNFFEILDNILGLDKKEDKNGTNK